MESRLSPLNMCPEGSPCILSEFMPIPLATLDSEIEKSKEWQINNGQNPGYVKRNRFNTVIIAMGAARHCSSPAAEEFKNHNLLSWNGEHFVKWVAFGKKKSEQIKLKNVLRSLRHGLKSY